MAGNDQEAELIKLLETIDTLNLAKVDLDDYYYQHRNFLFDIKIIFMTFVKVLKTKGISH